MSDQIKFFRTASSIYSPMHDGWIEGREQFRNAFYMAVQADHRMANKSEKQEEVARRLVACWNACEGISTEILEQSVVKPMLSDHTDAIAAQRDELLFVLKAWKSAEEYGNEYRHLAEMEYNISYAYENAARMRDAAISRLEGNHEQP